MRQYGEGIAPAEVLDVLGALVDKSLLLAEERADGVRYLLLETVRQYARDYLEGGDEEYAVRARHVASYLALVEQAKPRLRGVEQQTWMDRLEQEHDNIRAMLTWVHGRGDAAEGLRVVVAMARFWEHRGYLGEGRRWLGWMLNLADVAGIETVSSTLRAAALTAAARLAHRQGDYTGAVAMAEEGLALRRHLDDVPGLVESLNTVGYIALRRGDHERGAALLPEGETLCRACDDAQGLADILNNLAIVAEYRHNYAQATGLIEESLSLWRAVGNARGVALALNNLADLAQQQGQHVRTMTFAAEALTAYRALGDMWGTASALLHMGQAAHGQGEHRRARDLFFEGLELAWAGDHKLEVWGCVEGLAAVAAAQGQLEHAARLFGAVEALGDAMDLPRRAEGDIGTISTAHIAVRERVRAGAELLAAAWQVGRGLALEQSVEDALAAYRYDNKAIAVRS